MKNKLLLIYYFFLATIFLFSISITVWSILKGKYHEDYHNYKSLKYPARYMQIDTLILKKIENYTNLNDNAPGKEIVYGTSNNSKEDIKIVIGKKEFLNCKSNRCPIYQSRITDTYFLKDAPDAYYSSQFRSFLLTIILKVLFYPMLIYIIYILWKHR